jgi:hypothetical protein
VEVVMTQESTDITADQLWALHRAQSRTVAPLREELEKHLAAVIAERESLGLGFSQHPGYQAKWRAYKHAYAVWEKAAGVQMAILELWEAAALKEKKHAQHAVAV